METDAQAVRHWRSEIVGFHSEMIRRYAPSMRHRINLDATWRSACEQSMLAYEGEQQQGVVNLSTQCPFNFDDLIAEPIDTAALLKLCQP